MAAISITPPPAPPRPTLESAKALHRYTDAYHVARSLVALGQVIKAVGVIVGILLALAATLILLISQEPNASVLAGGAVLAAWRLTIVPLYICALATFVGFWTLGVLVCAKGQELEATLDCAVHSSPFLSDEQRATAMSLI